MTPLVLDSEEGVGESCEEDLGLNLNGLGEEEKKEGFVEGRERVMIDIGKLDKFPTPWHLQILKRPCIPDLLMASLGMKVCSESLSTSLVLPSGAPIGWDISYHGSYDKSISDGIFFLELLSSVQPRAVNWGLITKELTGVTAEARYYFPAEIEPNSGMQRIMASFVSV
ncbi:hypothetical protein KIW84_015060 [Lathyrus oleraceus]|uniref:Uncharacterized protein n=1 Tax=Pisum sativum TaxID=3888 RepID=A0A9D5BPA2_PEA|nr:hypothetical protein KIW84_015060 [Pisum sativum]